MKWLPQDPFLGAQKKRSRHFLSGPIQNFGVKIFVFQELSHLQVDFKKKEKVITESFAQKLQC